jgi:hypothetical protein
MMSQQPQQRQTQEPQQHQVMNLVQLFGYLEKPPNFGERQVSFLLAVYSREKIGDVWEESKRMVPVALFGEARSKGMAKLNLDNGSRLIVIGMLEVSPKGTLYVRARDIILAGGGRRRDEPNFGEQQAPQLPAASDDGPPEDDVPF